MDSSTHAAVNCGQIWPIKLPGKAACAACLLSVALSGDLLVLLFGDDALADSHLYHNGVPQATVVVSLDRLKAHFASSLNSLVRQARHDLVFQCGSNALVSGRFITGSIQGILKGFDNS